MRIKNSTIICEQFQSPWDLALYFDHVCPADQTQTVTFDKWWVLLGHQAFQRMDRGMLVSGEAQDSHCEKYSQWRELTMCSQRLGGLSLSNFVQKLNLQKLCMVILDA